MSISPHGQTFVAFLGAAASLARTHTHLHTSFIPHSTPDMIVCNVENRKIYFPKNVCDHIEPATYPNTTDNKGSYINMVYITRITTK